MILSMTWWACRDVRAPGYILQKLLTSMCASSPLWITIFPIFPALDTLMDISPTGRLCWWWVEAGALNGDSSPSELIPFVITCVGVFPPAEFVRPLARFGDLADAGRGIGRVVGLSLLSSLLVPRPSLPES